MAKLRITRIRGEVGRRENQRATLRHLGLHRIHMSVVREDSPVVRGMLRKIGHMVTVEEVQ